MKNLSKKKVKYIQNEEEYFDKYAVEDKKVDIIIEIRIAFRFGIAFL